MLALSALHFISKDLSCYWEGNVLWESKRVRTNIYMLCELLCEVAAQEFLILVFTAGFDTLSPIVPKVSSNSLMEFSVILLLIVCMWMFSSEIMKCYLPWSRFFSIYERSSPLRFSMQSIVFFLRICCTD
jgi:hypothetical protein